MFYDPTSHPFAASVESNHRAITEEFRALAPDDFTAWPEKFLYGEGWDVFGLLSYGHWMESNCKRCPTTMAIAKTIPGLTTMGFSVLQPHTEIAPHQGYSSLIRRCHLGLIVPEDCGMRVGTETRQWKEGRLLIFEDAVEHTAWNRSDAVRVVLLFDILKNPDSKADLQMMTRIGRELHRKHVPIGDTETR